MPQAMLHSGKRRAAVYPPMHLAAISTVPTAKAALFDAEALCRAALDGASGSGPGTVPMDQSIPDPFPTGRITAKTALEYADFPRRMARCEDKAP